MILASDTFNRSSSTLSGGWTELSGGSGAAFNTNMSCDGSFAVFDTIAVHGATLAGTTGLNNFLQCWMRLGDATGGNNVGLIFRFVSVDEFYFLRVAEGAGACVFGKKIGATFTNIAVTTLNPGQAWKRYSIRAVGSTFQLFIDQNHNTAFNGPFLTGTDSAITSPGLCGLLSTGNDAGGIGNTFWNDFKADDGNGDVIYVDTTFNGGVAGEGMGTAERPDLNIDWALNNCGAERGSTIKLVNAAYTNPTAAAGGSDAQFTIGHAGRWDAAYSFPTYDDANGQVSNPGAPNLIIEGADGVGSTLTEVRDAAFFTMRVACRGILFRGLSFNSSTNTNSKFVNFAGDTNGAFAVAKCRLDSLAASGDLIAVGSGTSPAQVDITLCYFRLTVANLVSFIRSASATNVGVMRIRMNVFDCRAAAMTTNTNSGVIVFPSTGLTAADALDVDHNTFLEIRSASATENALSFWTPADADGLAEFQNNIVYGQANPNQTAVGFYLPAGAVTGTLTAHHNGYFNVLTPRSAQVTNAGNEQDALDPAFVNPLASFTWQHTAGAGLSGEGTFPAIVISGDFRPTNAGYVHTADDSNPLLGVLDRGALQGYALPVVPAGSDIQVATLDRYCVSVVFDPGGVQETDLSGYLTGSRPLRMEKDVLLRRYKANDGELEFADPASLFVETNPASFLRHPVDNRPDWFNKRVEVQAQIGNSILVRFVGFVVDVTAERGVGRLTIANRFQALVDRPVRANTMGKIVSTLRFPGIGPSEISDLQAPGDGLFLGTIGGQGNGVAGLNGPPAQTYTVNFLEAGINTDFTVTGSVTGFEGRGRMELAGSWQSVTGYLDIDPRRAGGDFKDPASGPNKGETCTFEVLWRPTAGQGIIGAIREFLLDPLGAGLTPADLALDTFTALEGTLHDQVLPNIGAPVVPRLAATQGNVLDALAAMVLHAGCSLFETSDARIGLASFMPRTVPAVPVLCKTDDLMAAAVGHLQIYNEFAVLRTFDERNQKYTSGETWPPLVDNDSQVRYGRRLPAPSGLEFRGYDGSNEPWTKTVAQVLYERHKDPRTIYAVRTKIERLDAELDDVYRLDSEAPDIQVAFTDPATISKSITGSLTVDMEVISTEVVTAEGECGYLALDSPGKRLDDPCWRLF